MKRQDAEIEGVVLFGSLVRGDAVPGSDADILLVLTESRLPWRDGSARFTPEDIGMDMHVLAYAQAELDKMLLSGNTCVSSVLRDRMQL